MLPSQERKARSTTKDLLKFLKTSLGPKGRKMSLIYATEFVTGDKVKHIRTGVNDFNIKADPPSPTNKRTKSAAISGSLKFGKRTTFR